MFSFIIKIFIFPFLIILIILSDICLAKAIDCGCVSFVDSRFDFCSPISCYQYSSVAAAQSALTSDWNSGIWSYHCDLDGFDSSGDYWHFCSDVLSPSGTYNSAFYVACVGCMDSNQDGLCDSSGSALDSDGDGLPDKDDPCPNNPQPTCLSDPSIPDTIGIAGCHLDIKSLKSWLLGKDSFPFNFIYALYSILSPLFELSPEAPVFDLEISLDPNSKYSWIPDTFPIHFDFTPFDPLAALLRWSEIIGLCIALVYYGIKRQRSFAATGG